MDRLNRVRVGIIAVAFMAIMAFFIFHLYDIQIAQTGGSTDNTTTYTTITRVKAARGEILDRNGVVLVSNRATYDLVINHFVLLSAEGTNEHLYQLVKLCQKTGVKYNDHFPVTAKRPFTYTLDQYNSAYQGYFQTYLDYKGGLDSDITAPLLIESLRQRYNIPEEWSDNDARAVIGLRYELDLRGCVPSLPNFEFVTDADDASLSAVLELNIPGLAPEASCVREYNTTYAAHILGYTGAMSPDQWEYYKNIDGYEMDAVVGQTGLEAAFEEYLHGTDGWREDTVAADGTLISSRYLTEPKAGSNVHITIDINLQMAAEDRLATVVEELRLTEGSGSDVQGGAVVVMDVRTGQVLVCASYPSYDLGNFFEDYNLLKDDPYKPMYNRALQAEYPPGSTYKPSMVIAGIDSGTITSKTPITDLGKFTKYDDVQPSCLAWSSDGYTHGTITAAEALKFSCNYFFYELGDQMRISDIDATAKALGLGEPTGVEIPESLGQRANRETKKRLYGEDVGWYMGDQILAAIGQSDNRFTPMQLCVYASTLANRGQRFKATFLNRVVSPDYRTLVQENQPMVVSTLPISDDAFEAYSTGMHMVAHESGGTAYKTFANYPIPVAAKTGTAQTGIDGTSDHGAFICYAPLNEPQIAIAVYGERAGHGSGLAVVARSILDVYFAVDDTGDVDSYENQLS